MLKISIITPTFNSVATLLSTMKSLLGQSYQNFDYIIVDGGSTDGTQDLIRTWEPRFANRLRWISEPDKGIYDGMNKGMKLAQGDIVGILNSDDYFTSDDVLARVAEAFEADPTLDVVYGDVHFVKGNSSDIVRYYSSERFTSDSFKNGFMPAHPSVYVRKEVFDRSGGYNLDYKIAADFEWLVRLFCKMKVKARYLNMDFVTMRVGGTSGKNIHSRLVILKEDVRACQENGVSTSVLRVATKYLFKLKELRPAYWKGFWARAFMIR